MGAPVKNLRRTIAEACHLLYARGYVVATSGNVSTRMGDGLLITPSAHRKDTLSAKDIVACSMDGARRAVSKHASSELAMHVAAYAARPDIGAVIHAHPSYSVACSLADISLAGPLLPELLVYTGPVATVPYATPGSPAQAEAVKPFLNDHDALVLTRHGVLVLGSDLTDAIGRLEQLEYAARIIYLARAIGPVRKMAPQEVAQLIGYAEALGRTLPIGSRKYLRTT